ncbi:unnamed protein product, partial [Meganyctiphanes norvegica]
QVSAYDLDHGMNGEVHYYFMDGTNAPFLIDPVTGRITANQSLDRETKASYTLLVIGEDGAQTPLQGSCNVIITVNDINDNQPSFGQPGSLSVDVPESTEVGSDIGINLDVQDDDDSANEWDYTIVSGNEENYFSIDEITGRVYLEKQLDYDNDNTTKEFSMNVTVSDGFNLPIWKMINMIVSNDNDEPPVFNKTIYLFTVRENQEYAFVGI